MIKKLDHLVITTNKVDRIIKFYEELGFVSKSANGRIELFAGDFKINVHIKGYELFPHARNVSVGCNDLCFEIESNLEKFRDEIVLKGIDIELDIVERYGTRGRMRSIYLRDPDQNLIEFCNYE